MSEKTTITAPCSRCSGKMLYDRSTDDWVCFNCGHIAYTQAIPIVTVGNRRSRPSRAGYSLD